MNRAVGPYALRGDGKLGRCPRLVCFRAFGPRRQRGDADLGLVNYFLSHWSAALAMSRP